MNEFLEENKKVVIGVAVILAVVLVSLIGFNLLNRQSNGSDDKDSIPSYLNNDFSIESSSDVSRSSSPMLYDFIIGGVGTYDNLVDLKNDKSPFIVVVTKTDSSKIYYSYNGGYGQGDSINIINLLPSFSSEPEHYYLKTEEDTKAFHDLLDSSESIIKNSATEGDYQFYVIDYYELINNYNGKLGAVNFDDLLNDVQPGQLKRQLDNGYGYPTDIIRKCGDLDSIKEKTHYDFNDSFWDNVNYGEYIKSYKTDGSDDFVVITPMTVEVVAGTGTYSNTYAVNGNSTFYSTRDVDEYLTENGYQTVEEALKSADYANESEINSAFDLD